ncbi:Cellobiose phospho transferase system YdjC-like protein [Salmonella enterica subsp. salamae]|uniref:Cellobiose phospho transferase system YdjC-like protein n=1 Tax=Salmonella enterica subsp. salamae TaxID=59202 RepID=A0A6D2GAF8_SALER|nr:Cellobiose phospho transferase system YdjC-like protein [Salmonella enterica subsp. salamae]
MERVLIVNADDFGLSKGQNYGIVEAYRNGVVTSTTALVNGEAIDHAAQLSRELPALGGGNAFCFDVRQTGVRNAWPDARRPVREMDLANGGGGYASAG